METTTSKSRGGLNPLRGLSLRRGLAWGIIIIMALVAFEIFNFSTTQFALLDVLGDLKFAGIRWATILAIAFCGIDFAGIARLFTPEQGRDEPAEVWYLFGAWLLAAAFNAMLTWWGVSVAIANHNSQAEGVVVTSATLKKTVPVLVAIMVWLIRVLIIGTFSVAGERLFSQAETRSTAQARSVARSVLQPASSLAHPRTTPTATSFRPVTTARPARPEPTYHSVPLSAQSAREAEYVDPAY
ncbi:MAG: hypothetical protein NZL98_05045 [Anaerolineales bacterium]|nr:hypothetical protein [Anaerolineales bacterium]